MLFNSYTYIFLFLPLAVSGYFVLSRLAGLRWANGWLVLASLGFYGYWNIWFLPLLVGSILVNYAIARCIVKYLAEPRGLLTGKTFFMLGLAFDIGMLCYFKYMDFFIKNLNRLMGTDFELWHVILPLGISFFTITQMVYLIGVYFYGDGKKYKDFVDYCLFVSFFPHLLAGPILYHKSMMKQFADERLHTPQAENIAKGMAMFSFGLFKKVVIADALIAPIADGFAHAGELGFWEGWTLALCFFMEMYYDFSGYTDMAVGAARLMNIKIPINFSEPFRSKNLSEFWGKWHMSLTSTITAYIYTPLVLWMGKVTLWRSMFATMLTMVVIGAWHGAGWTFVVFGFMQGVGLCTCQLWKRQSWVSLPDSVSHWLTMVFAASSCVLFRAESLPQAIEVYKAMAGLRGLEWPFVLGGGLTDKVLNAPGLHGLPIFTLLLALWLAAYSHDSNVLVDKYFRPNLKWAAFLAFLFVFSVLHFTQVTAFLYFQF